MISIVDGHVVHQDFDLAAAKNQIEIPSRLVGFLDKSIHRLLQGRHLKKKYSGHTATKPTSGHPATSNQ